MVWSGYVSGEQSVRELSLPGLVNFVAAMDQRAIVGELALIAPNELSLGRIHISSLATEGRFDLLEFH